MFTWVAAIKSIECDLQQRLTMTSLNKLIIIKLSNYLQHPHDLNIKIYSWVIRISHKLWLMLHIYNLHGQIGGQIPLLNFVGRH